MQKRAKASSSRSAIRSLALCVIVTHPHTTLVPACRRASFGPKVFGPRLSDRKIPHFRDGVPCYYHRNGARAGPPERLGLCQCGQENEKNYVTNSVTRDPAVAGKRRYVSPQRSQRTATTGPWGRHPPPSSSFIPHPSSLPLTLTGGGGRGKDKEKRPLAVRPDGRKGRPEGRSPTAKVALLLLARQSPLRYIRSIH